VQTEFVRPDLLVAEGIKAKDLSAFGDFGSRSPTRFRNATI